MNMKVITAVPAIKRFFWEVEVLLTNLKEVAPNVQVVVIFDDNDPLEVERLQAKYPQAEMYIYDTKDYVEIYHPARQLYLFYRYFNEDETRENDLYLQVDTDIIFREFPKIPKITGKKALGGDCSGYIDYDYLITRQNGGIIIKGFADILNIDTEVIRDTPGIGAQYLINKPTAQLYWHMWQDSLNYYHFLERIESDIQRFTAGMWSQLYNLAKFGWEVSIYKELSHCSPTDNIEMWNHRNVLHNAGVVGVGAAGLFYKSQYINTAPFYDNLSWVRKDRCSIKYVEAINKVVL